MWYFHALVIDRQTDRQTVPAAKEAGADDAAFVMIEWENFAGVSLLRHFARLFWNQTCIMKTPATQLEMSYTF